MREWLKEAYAGVRAVARERDQGEGPEEFEEDG